MTIHWFTNIMNKARFIAKEHKIHFPTMTELVGSPQWSDLVQRDQEYEKDTFLVHTMPNKLMIQLTDWEKYLQVEPPVPSLAFKAFTILEVHAPEFSNAMYNDWIDESAFIKLDLLARLWTCYGEYYMDYSFLIGSENLIECATNYVRLPSHDAVPVMMKNQMKQPSFFQF